LNLAEKEARQCLDKGQIVQERRDDLTLKASSTTFLTFSGRQTKIPHQVSQMNAKKLGAEVDTKRKFQGHGSGATTFFLVGLERHDQLSFSSFGFRPLFIRFPLVVCLDETRFFICP